jgi:hypothetical protein
VPRPALATVEKIGPSSEASAASQSFSRAFSGIGCASQIADVRRFAFSQSACCSHNSFCRSGLPLIVGVSGELVALARQPRTVHRAEYPHASK